MFWIKYEDENGGEVEVALNPPPREIMYPPRKHVTTQETQDGAVVIQRPTRDTRTRRLIWLAYGPKNEPFASQWALFESLECRSRMDAGLPASVGFWEDVTEAGGFDRTDGQGEKIYTRVKIIQVDRMPRQGGGPVRYESTVEFVIDDPSFSGF